MNKTTTFLTFFSLLFLSTFTFAKSTGTISGKIIDATTGEAAPFANVILYAAADSSMVKGEVTRENGIFKLINLKATNYWLSVTYIGFEEYRSEVFALSDGQNLDMPPIELQASSVELIAAEVVAKRALIEVQPDKTVFNVEGSINATGNTALELLRKSPGVVVDNNDNIILSGKDGVQIYIDGKPSQLSTEDLAIQLRAMQSAEIDAIEIITNPSAKYDAEGNAGIINIRLKKDKRYGANASLNLGYAYGYHHRYNGSTTFNYRNPKSNVFGSYSYNGGDSENWINLYRIQNNVLYDQESVNLRGGDKHSFKLGTDFFLSKKSTLGVMVNGYWNVQDWSNESHTPITDLATENLTSVLDATAENDGLRKNLNANINYSFDKGGGESWNIDADWGIFKNTNDAYQPNYYKLPDGETITDSIAFTSNAPTDIEIYTLKGDHERKLWGGNFGAGMKFSYVKTDNIYDFYNLVNASEILDTTRSNKFVFDENINAAYLTFTKQYGKFTANVGIRAEQTNSKGVLTALQETNNDEVNRHYLDFFPSGGLTYQHNQKHQFRVNYSRRVDRPNYQDLNPFEFKLSELSYRRGNPFLQPQYSNSVSVSHTFNYTLTTNFSFTHTHDFFANISDSTEVIRSFLETINLDYQRVINLSISYPVSLTKWWSTYTNLVGYHKRNYADLGEGRIVDVKANAVSLYHQSTFSLPLDFTFELSGWYSSPSIWGAVYKTDGNFSIDMGVQKKLWNKRGNLKVSVTDIFQTTPWRGVQEFAGFYVEASGGWESRQIRLNFSYLFGNDQVKKSRKRNTGLEDEVKRTK